MNKHQPIKKRIVIGKESFAVYCEKCKKILWEEHLGKRFIEYANSEKECEK